MQQFLEQSIFPISIWLDQVSSYLHVSTNNAKINLPRRKGKCQIEVGSIECFEKYSRVMESCACVIARNVNSNRRFSDEINPQL